MITLQIQTVLYHNDKDALLKALLSVHNALRVDKEKGHRIESAVLRYGDASSARLFSDDEIAGLNERFGDCLTVEYRFFGENTGTARGHNLLAQDGTSSFMMIMNPDIIIAPDFFEMMLAPFDDRAAKVGLVEARQTPIEHPKEYDPETGKTAWASTAAVVFPRAVFEEVGGFDSDTFFMYCDDVDFSWRIRLAGYAVIYQPKAPVFHAKRLSVSGNWQSTSAEAYYSAEAALLMAYKWSNDPLCRRLLHEFRTSKDPNLRKAASEFLSRKQDGRLPRQLDADHAVATFINGNYATHRFTL